MRLTSLMFAGKGVGRKALKVIQRHKENQSLFGELLETKQEKVKRTRYDNVYSSPPIKKSKEMTTGSQPEDNLADPNFVPEKKLNRRRNLYNPVIFPRAESIRVEQAGVSINKNRVEAGGDQHANDRVESISSTKQPRPGKDAEIEWTLKYAPTMMKLIELPSVTPTEQRRKQKQEKMTMKPSAFQEDAVMTARNDNLYRDEPAAWKAPSSVAIKKDPFSLPYYKVESKIAGDDADLNDSGSVNHLLRGTSLDEKNVSSGVSSKDTKMTESTIISFSYPRSSYNSRRDSENPVDNEVIPTNQRCEQLELERGPLHASTVSPKLPSVSKILNATMPEEQAQALKRWEAKMISQLGEEGFRQYKANILTNGKSFHSNIECYLRGTSADEILVAEPNQGHWNSLSAVITSIEHVHVLESHVIHPELQYCGVIDCIAEFRNRLVLIDWKTSQKPKPFVSMTYDTPLQIAAYIGAINYDPRYSMKINDGLIVVAYEDGSSCQTFQLGSEDLWKYWKRWLARLQLYRQMNPQV